MSVTLYAHNQSGIILYIRCGICAFSIKDTSMLWESAMNANKWYLQRGKALEAWGARSITSQPQLQIRTSLLAFLLMAS